MRGSDSEFSGDFRSGSRVEPQRVDDRQSESPDQEDQEQNQSLGALAPGRS